MTTFFDYEKQHNILLRNIQEQEDLVDFIVQNEV